MKLSALKRTQDAPQSHVDLDGVQAIRDGHVHIHEVRVYEALKREDLRGLRAIERASGLSRTSVLRVIPPAATMRTALLYRSAQGSHGWHSEDRELMRIEPARYTSSVDQRIIYPFNSLKGQEGTETPEGTKSFRSSGPQMSLVEKLLDPSLDVWSNNGDEESLGDAGWALAMVTRFRPMDLTLAEIGVICRLSIRQVQRLVKKLKDRSWASSVQVGRKVLVTVDFSLMTHEDLVDNYLKTSRLVWKSRQHQAEAEAVREMGTEDGRSIRKLWKNRREEGERIRRLLEGIPEHLRHRLDRLLKFLNTPDDRRDQGWMSRWEGERVLRKCLSNH
jgi:hypothetical protein